MKYNLLKEVLNTFPFAKKALKIALKAFIDRKHRNNIEQYNNWLNRIEPKTTELIRQQTESDAFAFKPLISVVTPVYNTPETFFREMVESVINQSYQNWELILVDDASPNPKVRKLIEEYANKDFRITYKFLDKGLHIAGATNEAIKLAKGDFVSLFDHDDILRPNALYEIAAALNKNSNLDFIYTDEDKIIDGISVRADPFFKPDWNQDFLYSVNYITHFSTIRKSLFDEIGYEDANFNGAQDWELYLRITRNINKNNIHHIPLVLYSWRVHSESTAKSLDAKPYVIESQEKAILEDIISKKYKNSTLSRDKQFSAQWRLEFEFKNPYKVLIVVPEDLSNNHHLVGSLTKRIQLTNYEIITWDTISESEGDFVIFATARTVLNDIGIQTLVGDAARHDIGYVTTYERKKKAVFANMRTILNKDVCDFLEKLNDSLSYHYYRTARYNIREVNNFQTLLIEKSKLDEIKISGIATGDVGAVGRLLLEKDYRHLYNPYAKV